RYMLHASSIGKKTLTIRSIITQYSNVICEKAVLLREKKNRKKTKNNNFLIIIATKCQSIFLLDGPPNIWFKFWLNLKNFIANYTNFDDGLAYFMGSSVASLTSKCYLMLWFDGIFSLNLLNDRSD
ncbi:hypothetical protein ACJX0J_005682, partial [Zea mays]